jgi:uncharacterized YigZ family protein
MVVPTRYVVPAAVHRVATEVSRSRFIATVGPAATPADAAALVRRVRDEFADATHNAWAYVAGPPGSTAQVGTDDDGEVRGTAGRPMLTVLLHGGVGDVAAVVTRYYGGTKLGTGGLARAYGGAVQRALQTLPRAERVDRVRLTAAVSYPDGALLRQLLAEHEVEVVSEGWAEGVTYELRLPLGNVERFRAAVLNATRGQARIGGGEPWATG